MVEKGEYQRNMGSTEENLKEGGGEGVWDKNGG